MACEMEVVNRCIDFIQNHRIDEAADAVRAFHALSPPTSLSLQILGIVRLRRGAAEAAARILQAAIVLDPTNPSAYFNLARAVRVLGEDRAAFRESSRALAIKPDFAAARDIAAAAATRMGAFVTAAAMLDQIDGSEVSEVMAFIHAECLLRLRRTSQAREILVSLAETGGALAAVSRLLRLDLRAETEPYLMVLVRRAVATHPVYRNGWRAALMARRDFADHPRVEPPAQPAFVGRVARDWPVHELSGIDVVGGDNVLVDSDAGIVTFEHGMRHADRDRLQWTQVIDPIDDRTCLVILRERSRTLDSGLWLNAANSGNYFHFMFEVLPRLLAADGIVPEAVPLLVDQLSWAVPQIREMIQRADRGRRRIEIVGLHERVRVERLYASWGYADLLPGIADWRLSRIEDDVIPPATCALIRHGFRHLMHTGAADLDLVVTRQGARKRCINEDELWERALKRGFVPVDPGALSFAEQVALFSRARTVVAVSGAALTNMVFMPSGSRAVILPVIREACGMWTSIADAVGIDVRFLEGELVETALLGPDVKFRIDPDAFATLLDLPPGFAHQPTVSQDSPPV